LRDTQIFELTFEAPPIARHLAKFRGDRPRELGDLGPKWGKKQLPPKFMGGHAPQFWYLHYLSSHTSNHVRKFHGDRPRELGDITPQSARNKQIKKNISSKA